MKKNKHQAQNKMMKRYTCGIQLNYLNMDRQAEISLPIL